MSLVRRVGASSDSGNAAVVESRPKAVWATPSDTPDVDLSAVASFVANLVEQAGPDDTTPANEYQDAAATHFRQPLEGSEWDAWFVIMSRCQGNRSSTEQCSVNLFGMLNPEILQDSEIPWIPLC